jgi:hypothetical protein
MLGPTIKTTERHLVILNETGSKFPEQSGIAVDRMFVEDIIENLHWNLVYEVKLT